MQKLLNSEPYVLYHGFKMGYLPSSEGLSELSEALKTQQKIIILIDDTDFAQRVYRYLRIGRSSLLQGEDETILQRACFLASTNCASDLLCSLPTEFTHPALIFIQENFYSTINLSVAPSLVKTQIHRWGLDQSRIFAYSKLALENKVDLSISGFRTETTELRIQGHRIQG